MEEGGACARLASGFFYGLVGQTQTGNSTVCCCESDLEQPEALANPGGASPRHVRLGLFGAIYFLPCN
jgi:hypothetical protein